MQKGELQQPWQRQNLRSLIIVELPPPTWLLKMKGLKEKAVDTEMLLQLTDKESKRAN